MARTANTLSQPEREHLIGALKNLREKMRRMLLAYGLGIALACAVGALLATVLLDWTLNLPAIPRICVGLLGLGAIGYAVWRQLIVPLSAKRSISDIAGRLEHVFPVFDDRLRSTVDFVQTQVPGSETMKDLVVHEASQLAKNVDLKSALVYRPVRLSWYGAMAALAVLIGLAVLFPNYRGIAESRLFNPFGAAQWPKRVQIETVGSIPRLVAIGQRIPLTIKLAKGDKASMEVRVYYQYDDGTIEHDIMPRNDDKTYSASLDAKGSLLKVWIVAGDDQTPQSVIRVVPRLEIQHVEMEILPPPYVHTDVHQSVNLSGGPAIAVAGSSLVMHVQFSKPLDPKETVELTAAAPEFVGKVPTQDKLAWSSDGVGRCTCRFNASETIRFHILAKDLDGFANKALEEYELTVRPDQLPSVSIEMPRSDAEYTTLAKIPLQIAAEDDFGIEKMTLVVERDANSATTQPTSARSHWDIPLKDWQLVGTSNDKVHYRLDYPWLLSSLEGADLKPGDVLHFWITVNDNYDLADPANPNGPHLTHPAVASGKLRATIISQEQLTEQALSIFNSVFNAITDIQKTQNSLRVQNDQLKDASQNKKEFDAGNRANAERIANEQSTAASHTRQESEVLAQLEKRLADNQSESKDLMSLAHSENAALKDTAENPMKDAVNQVNTAKDQQSSPSDSPEKKQSATDQRNNSLAQAGTDMKQASEQLQKSMDRMGNVNTSLEKKIHDWEKALNDQTNLAKETQDLQKDQLGKKPEDMTAEARDKANELAKKQETQAKETDKNTKALQDAAKQSQKSDPAASEAFSKAAEQSKSKGISQSQSDASKSMQDNQRDKSQSSQQQAELGLQTVLSTLRAEQQRRLEKLVAELNDAVAKLTLLVERQAGHNFDNLLLQKKTAEEIDKIDKELRKEAEKYVSAEHLKPDVPLLTSSQIQTEQNTRNDTAKIASLPDTTEIVSDMTLASGKMVNAIASLRDDKAAENQKLASAFDPHQSGALAALKDALKLLQAKRDEEKKKSDDAKQEEIRKAFIEVRQDQRDKINAPTLPIDSSPRLPDGSLRREQAMLLDTLPPIQQKLSDKCKELGDRLLAIKTIEFVSANEEVRDTMAKVKELLAKRSTGKPTQAEQLAIDEELTAIIDSLKIEKDKDEFEKPQNGGGGGGGGGGPPKMPSEAELRLVKAVQLILNRLTKVADADETHDKTLTGDVSDREAKLRKNLDALAKGVKVADGVGPDPDPTDVKKLSQQASDEQIDNKELEDQLLGGKSDENEMAKVFAQVGDRMFAVKTFMADNQPGQTTQTIEKRIVANLDMLIDMAKKSQSQQQQGQGKGQGGQKPGESSEQAQNQGSGNSQPNRGSQPANGEKISHADENNATLKELEKQAAAESNWGHTSPRLHDAILEGQGEHVIDKFDTLVRRYFQDMAKESNQEPPH